MYSLHTVFLCIITTHEIHVIALNKNLAALGAVFYELVTSFYEKQCMLL